MPNILAMILAGGEGRRLSPLTSERSKSAVPFGGHYRIIDVVLSNFVHSGIFKIKVITQFMSESLNTHLSRAWRLAPILNHYVEPVPAQMRVGKHWYRGNADAIYQNLNVITDAHADHVCVFGGDHIYKMDVRQMIRVHVKNDADLTVAAVPVPIEQAKSFGVIGVDANWQMNSFEEKPDDPQPMPGNEHMALVSMGNYIFKAGCLIQEVQADARQASSHDFGYDIITGMYQRTKVMIYDFSQNNIPHTLEKERGYWRDIGTIDSYYEVSMDLVSVDPTFNLYDERWPIITANLHYPPVKFVFNEDGRRGIATDSLVSNGVVVSGGYVNQSILSPGVRVNSRAVVEASILFDHVEIGRSAKVRRAIIDKNVKIPEGAEIGYDLERDRKRFRVTPSGIVVIPKNTIIVS